jgi:hypothetical protein
LERTPYQTAPTPKPTAAATKTLINSIVPSPYFIVGRLCGVLKN